MVDHFSHLKLNPQSKICQFCKKWFTLKLYDSHFEQCTRQAMNKAGEIKEKQNDIKNENSYSPNWNLEKQEREKDSIALNKDGKDTLSTSRISLFESMELFKDINHRKNLAHLFDFGTLNEAENRAHKKLFSSVKKTEYNLIQCKFCQNLIENNTIKQNAHMEYFHRCPYLKSNDGMFEYPLHMASEYNIYCCTECFVYMEDSFLVKNNHITTIHQNGIAELSERSDTIDSKSTSSSNLYSGEIHNNVSTPKNNLNLKHNDELYCTACLSQVKATSHFHHSFMVANKQHHELFKYFNEATKEKLPIKELSPQKKFHFPNVKQKKKTNQKLFTPYNNPLKSSSGSSPVNKDQNIDSFSDSFDDYYENDLNWKFNLTPEFEQILKQMEKFTSMTRLLANDTDKKFFDVFASQMFSYCDIPQENFYYSTHKQGSTAVLLKRLQNEFKKFSENLPCNFSSSFFLKADTNNPQNIKVLIAGARGTPYEHGLFEYDIFIPTNYPNEPPKCVLKTTGGGKIRFNPNLYADGKVCLSLLGTWPGSSVEKWDSTKSNLTQLLLSLSSLVMNDRVIENEPGCGGSMSSIQGIEENEGYSNIIRAGNISFAVVDIIKNPPKGFEKIVQEYFQFKGKEIMLDMQMWITRATKVKTKYTGITLCHNPEWCNLFENDEGAFVKMIGSKLDEMRELLHI